MATTGAVDVSAEGEDTIEEIPHADDITDERAPDDLSSDESDDDDGSDEVNIGVPVKCQGEPGALLRNQFASKLGGKPAWLDPAQLPVEAIELRCKASGERLKFLLQLYAPVNEDPRAFHRALYLFISPKGSKLAERGAVRAFRSQLPRQNAFYPYEPPEPHERPMPLSAASARLAARRCPSYADEGGALERSALKKAGKAALADYPPTCYPEYELVVEPEPSASEQAAHDPQVSRMLAEYQEKLKQATDKAAKKEAAALAAAELKAKAKELADAKKQGTAAAADDGVEAPKGESTEGGKEGGKGGGKEGDAVSDDEEENDLSAFPGRNPEMEDFNKFTLRVSRVPNQVVRYTFAEESSPLWTSRNRQPTPQDIPLCERCGAARRFEFQVMPQCINLLNVDSSDDDAPDWATIAVYTCSRSCAPLPPLPKNGGLEDPLSAPAAGGATAAADEGTEERPAVASAATSASQEGDARANGGAALAAIGMRMRIEGLSGRPDLNGTECEVLHWHAPSSRWAVECTPAEVGADGERMRIKSANLRPLPLAVVGEGESEAGGAAESDGGILRDGGYAEEFVWVQMHQ